MKPSTIRAVSGLLALGVVSSALDVAVLAPSALSRTKPVLSRRTSAVELRLRQSPGRVDVVVAGLGTKVRAVSQSQSDGRWSARLTGVDLGDRPFTPQQRVLSSSELLSVRLEPLESDLQLIVKARMGERVPTPTIGSNGDSLVVSFAGLSGPEQRSSGRLDLRRPGRVAQPVMAPPMRSRASAPPLGDIAVGTMLVNPNGVINISGPPVSLTLNNASAKDALMSLARIGGLGFVYVNPKDNSSEESQKSELVSLSFKDESFGRAINSILFSSGLQARLDGRTLLVGENLQKSGFAPQMSKVFRLNQASTETAANYLSSLGAKMSKVIQIEVTTGEAASSGTSELSNQVSQTKSIESEIETLEAQEGPLLGLVGTTDGRLGTVTVVGEPRLISLAESYLKQIDLRRRQVALKVQIISVQLDNERGIDSSFSARMGNTFIVSDSGAGHINFGPYKPGGVLGSGIYGEGVSGVPGTYSNLGQVQRQRVIDPVVASQTVVDPVVGDQAVVIDPEDPSADPTLQPIYDSNGRTVYVPDTNPVATQTLLPAYDSNGRPIYVPDTNPASAQTLLPVYDKKGRLKYVQDSDQYRQPDNSFYSYLEAQIQSKSAKILAEPTLLVGEGQTSAVKTGLEVVVNVDEDGSFVKETAGLTLTVGVDKIDDNGFVSMNIIPKLGFPVPAGNVDGIPFYNIDTRELLANGIRLRDRQTLIVSGVISERQSEVVKKWPFLGDLPIFGALFRASQSERTKEELVVVVTPQVLDDEQGGLYGYGYYSPGTVDVQQVLNSDK